MEQFVASSSRIAFFRIINEMKNWTSSCYFRTAVSSLENSLVDKDTLTLRTFPVVYVVVTSCCIIIIIRVVISSCMHL
jgi:hypothetical protein